MKIKKKVLVWNLWLDFFLDVIALWPYKLNLKKPEQREQNKSSTLCTRIKYQSEKDFHGNLPRRNDNDVAFVYDHPVGGVLDALVDWVEKLRILLNVVHPDGAEI